MEFSGYAHLSPEVQVSRNKYPVINLLQDPEFQSGYVDVGKLYMAKEEGAEKQQPTIDLQIKADHSASCVMATATSHQSIPSISTKY